MCGHESYFVSVNDETGKPFPDPEEVREIQEKNSKKG
jgi:hypothetical protein